MFKKFAITLLSIFLLTFNANAGSDGEINLNQGRSTDVKDCFEKLNRATFALNQGLLGFFLNILLDRKYSQ